MLVLGNRAGVRALAHDECASDLAPVWWDASGVTAGQLPLPPDYPVAQRSGRVGGSVGSTTHSTTGGGRQGKNIAVEAGVYSVVKASAHFAGRIGIEYRIAAFGLCVGALVDGEAGTSIEESEAGDVERLVALTGKGRYRKGGDKIQLAGWAGSPDKLGFPVSAGRRGDGIARSRVAAAANCKLQSQHGQDCELLHGPSCDWGSQSDS